MANVIALAQAYLADPSNLNEVYKAASKTADLEAQTFQWLGGNVVKMPLDTFDAAGLGTYDRATGFVALDVDRTWDTYTLSQDKGNKVLVDRLDMDESLMENGIISVANKYIRKVVVPAIDTYRFSKLVSGAGTTKLHTAATTDNTITSSNVIAKLDEAFQTLAENEVEGELILYMTPAVKFSLEQALDKKVVLGMWGGDATAKVEIYRDAKIVEVPASRLGTNINFILIARNAVASIVRHQNAVFWAPGQVPGLDAGQIDYRVYYDLFVIANKTKGVYVSKAALA